MKAGKFAGKALRKPKNLIRARHDRARLIGFDVDNSGADLATRLRRTRAAKMKRVPSRSANDLALAAIESVDALWEDDLPMLSHDDATRIEAYAVSGALSYMLARLDMKSAPRPARSLAVDAGLTCKLFRMELGMQVPGLELKALYTEMLTKGRRVFETISPTSVAAYDLAFNMVGERFRKRSL